MTDADNMISLSRLGWLTVELVIHPNLQLSKKINYCRYYTLRLISNYIYYFSLIQMTTYPQNLRDILFNPIELLL